MPDIEEGHKLERVFKGEGWAAVLRQYYRIPYSPLEPDPKWVHTDAAGHVHRYEEIHGQLATPTLIKKTRLIPGKYEDDADLREEAYLVCLECGEEIEPGEWRPPQEPVPSVFTGVWEAYIGEGAHPVPETALRKIQVGDFVPGMKGEAVIMRTQTHLEQGRKIYCRLEFEGQGELVGLRNGR